jgi:hypothetical protein
MANINELEWNTPEGEKFPVTNTVIGGEEVQITKLEEDSYIITSTDNEENTLELDLKMLDSFLESDKITWVHDTQLIPDPDTPLLTSVNKVKECWESDMWKEDSNGNLVLEIDHINHPGKTLSVIKRGEDDFLVHIYPKDKPAKLDEYSELNANMALFNVALAKGLDTITIASHLIPSLYGEEASETEDAEDIYTNIDND